MTISAIGSAYPLPQILPQPPMERIESRRDVLNTASEAVESFTSGKINVFLYEAWLREENLKKVTGCEPSPK